MNPAINEHFDNIHTHFANGSVQPVAEPPDGLAVIDEIERRLALRPAMN